MFFLIKWFRLFLKFEKLWSRPECPWFPAASGLYQTFTTQVSWRGGKMVPPEVSLTPLTMYLANIQVELRESVLGGLEVITRALESGRDQKSQKQAFRQIRVHRSSCLHQSKVASTSVTNDARMTMRHTHTAKLCSDGERNAGLIHRTAWMNLQHLALSGRSRARRSHVVWFQSRDTSGIGESGETEGRWVVAGDLRAGHGA